MRLARCSLFAAALGATTGCLDTPPSYSAPVQSPPIILGNQVDPATSEVTTIILPHPSQPLKVPFRSIDAGEDLTAVLWLDFDPSRPQNEIFDQQWLDARSGLPADSRPLDEQDRSVTFEWDPKSSRVQGCHTFTVQLAHESTFPIDPPTGKFQPGELAATNSNDIGQVTWYFDVQDPTNPAPKPVCWSTVP